MDDEAVTMWFRQLTPGGDAAAAQRLWQHYYERLLRLARAKLGSANRRVSDEEDVVLSAFHSFYQAAVTGRFPCLEDRDDLWKLLVVFTARKAIDHLRDCHRQKRGGGEIRGESAFHAGGDDGAGGFEQVVGTEPTPEFAALMCEQYESLLDQLSDESLRQIALLRLENYTVDEIAEKLHCSVRTVKRRLALIRAVWQKPCGDAPPPGLSSFAEGPDVT